MLGPWLLSLHALSTLSKSLSAWPGTKRDAMLKNFLEGFLFFFFFCFFGDHDVFPTWRGGNLFLLRTKLHIQVADLIASCTAYRKLSLQLALPSLRAPLTERCDARTFCIVPNGNPSYGTVHTPASMSARHEAPAAILSS